MIRSSFVIILFIISSCANSTLKFVPHSDFTKEKQNQKTCTVKSTDLSDNSDKKIVEENHSPVEIETEKKSLTAKLEDKVEEIEKNNFEEFNFSKRLDQFKHATKQLTAKDVKKADRLSDSSKEKNSKVFLIVGLSFAILSMIFFVKFIIVSQNTVEPSFGQSLDMLGWMILCSIFGVIALMLLLISFAVFLASKEKQTE